MNSVYDIAYVTGPVDFFKFLVIVKDFEPVMLCIGQSVSITALSRFTSCSLHTKEIPMCKQH